MSKAFEIFIIGTYALWFILAFDRVMIALERHEDEKERHAKNGGEHRRQSRKFRHWIRYRVAHPWPIPRSFGAHRSMAGGETSRPNVGRGNGDARETLPLPVMHPAAALLPVHMQLHTRKANQ